MAQGVFKIGSVASLGMIIDDADARIAECTDDIERVVGGAVVGDDYLIAFGQLRADRGELLGDVGGTIICGYADGEH